MAEGALHARPEYDFDERGERGDIHRTFRHFDYPSNESLIPPLGAQLTGTNKLEFCLILIDSKPDPKSVQDRRRLIVLVYERTEYAD